MELRQQILRFLNRYQTVGWLLLFLGGGLLLQLLIMLILPREASATVLSYLVLPARLKDLIMQPWSLVTWPFFMLKFQPFTLLISGFILWGFGQIHQHLLGDTRTRRLLILAVPLIGLLTVTISSFLPAGPFEAGSDYVTIEEVSTVIGENQNEGAAELPDSVTDDTEPTAREIANSRPPIERKDLLSDPAKARQVNLWFPSGGMPLVMVLVVSCATLVPSYPVQLFLFGRVKIVWIAAILLVLELLWAVFFTPMAIAIAVGAGLGFLHVYLLRSGTDITESVWSYYSDGSSPKMKVKYGDMTTSTKASSSKSSRDSAGSGISQDVIDKILDKISDKGYESLSREEKELLFKASTDKEDE